MSGDDRMELWISSKPKSVAKEDMLFMNSA